MTIIKDELVERIDGLLEFVYLTKIGNCKAKDCKFKKNGTKCNLSQTLITEEGKCYFYNEIKEIK